MCRRWSGGGQLGGQHHKVGAVGQQGRVSGVLAPAESTGRRPGSPSGGQACRGSRLQARYNQAWHKHCNSHSCVMFLLNVFRDGCDSAQQFLADSMVT